MWTYIFYVDVYVCNDNGTFKSTCIIAEAVLWNKGNASSAIREFRRIKNLRREPMPTKCILNNIKRKYKTVELGVQPRSDPKPVTPVLVNVVKRAVAAQSHI